MERQRNEIRDSEAFEISKSLKWLHTHAGERKGKACSGGSQAGIEWQRLDPREDATVARKTAKGE